jgi:hypothetical protein
MRPSQSFSNLPTDVLNVKPRLDETGRGLTCFYRDRYLYSSRDPLSQPRKLAENALLKPESLVLVPSPLLGYGLDGLIERLPETTWILAVESDQNLMGVSIERIPAALLEHPRFVLIRTDSIQGISVTLEKIGLWRFRRTEWLPLSQSWQLDTGFYREVFSFLQRTIKNFWDNRITSIKLGRLWISNFFRNLPLLDGALRLPVLAQDKPVLLCGAGESLEKAVPRIRQWRDRFYLLSVDTALPALTRNGITPDAVLVLESQYWNILDFYQTIGREIPLIADLTAYPASLRTVTGPLCLFMTRFAPLSLLDRLRDSGSAPVEIPPLGSVGVTGLYVARALAPGKPVWVAGLDFSYRRGKSHCRGALSHDLYLNRNDRLHADWLYPHLMKKELLPVEGKPGIFTDSGMEFYARLFIERMEGIEVYRLSEEFYPLGLKESVPDEPKEVTALFANAAPSGGDATVTTESFVANEIRLLDEVISEWARYENEGDPDRLLESLKACDYLTFHFADRLPHPRNEAGFLFRAVMEARKKLVMLERISRPRRF